MATRHFDFFFFSPFFRLFYFSLLSCITTTNPSTKMARGYVPKGRKEGKSRSDTASIETTIHMHKYLKGRTFKKRAPFAAKVVRNVARQVMGTTDNRIEVRLNKAIWSKGIKGCPTRIRVRLEKKRNEDEDAKQPLYTVC